MCFQLGNEVNPTLILCLPTHLQLAHARTVCMQQADHYKSDSAVCHLPRPPSPAIILGCWSLGVQSGATGGFFRLRSSRDAPKGLGSGSCGVLKTVPGLSWGFLLICRLFDASLACPETLDRLESNCSNTFPDYSYCLSLAFRFITPPIVPTHHPPPIIHPHQ
jgi:hypothetical protein